VLIAPVIVANTPGESNLGRVSSHKSFLQNNFVWVLTWANEIGIQEAKHPQGGYGRTRCAMVR
jgi:hypothetical protein